MSADGDSSAGGEARSDGDPIVSLADVEVHIDNEWLFDLMGSETVHAVDGVSLDVFESDVVALDVSLRVEMMVLLLGLQEQFDTSYLFISHDPSNEKYLTADADGRICSMYLGELVEIGPPERIIQGPQHLYTKVLLWATSSLRGPGSSANPPSGRSTSPTRGIRPAHAGSTQGDRRLGGSAPALAPSSSGTATGRPASACRPTTTTGAAHPWRTRRPGRIPARCRRTRVNPFAHRERPSDGGHLSHNLIYK